MTPEKSDTVSQNTKRAIAIPELRTINTYAGVECFFLGLSDFRKGLKFSLFFGSVYTIGGWFIMWLLFWQSMIYLAYPVALGFAFIAPFVAAGTYEISRSLEIGKPLSWEQVLGTVWQQKGRDMGWMALISGFAFFVWVDWGAIVFLLFFGLAEIMKPELFFEALMTTQKGLHFILLGNFVGAIMAVIVFSLTVISFPLLLDHDLDFVTAMTTSVRAVLANPMPMFIWAVIIGVCLLVSIITLFITLPIILPVLGHGTWHMYRKVVV